MALNASHKKREFFGLCASALAIINTDKDGSINAMSPLRLWHSFLADMVFSQVSIVNTEKLMNMK